MTNFKIDVYLESSNNGNFSILILPTSITLSTYLFSFIKMNVTITLI